MKILPQILLVVLAWGVLFPQAIIFEKATESLKTYFGDSTEITKRSYKYSDKDSVDIFTCSISKITVGYGLLDNVKGKSQPITFLTVIDTSGDVVDVNILIYRESHGGEVQNESFRKQFRGMNAKSKIEIGKDIKSISGATISSRSVANGVKKIMRVFEIIKPSLGK